MLLEIIKSAEKTLAISYLAKTKKVKVVRRRSSKSVADS